jgi:hypothetical protein
MARSIWNGTIVFGLVAVPIKAYSATESRTVHFHEVHAKDGSRIEHRRICPKHRGRFEVDYDDIVKGYEVSKGRWVELTDDEIAAAAGSQSRRLEIDHFVPVEDVDPVFYERTYYLGAQDKGRDAYALLHAALDRAGRAGVGRWIFHNRERTVLLRPCSPPLRRASPDGPLALDRLAQLRARQRAPSRCSAAWSTPTCTSASCTPRTTRRSRSTASAPTRTSRCRTRISPTATRPTAARVPAAGRGDEPHRARRARPLRAAHQGVPRAHPRARRAAHAHDAALPRRRPPDQGPPDADQEGQAVQAGDRPGRRADRGVACPWDPARYEDRYQKRLKLSEIKSGS